MKRKVKTVGKRPVPWRVSAESARAWQRTVAEWHPGRALCDPGLHRFRTFEEADEWMIRQQAKRARERRRRQTSTG